MNLSDEIIHYWYDYQSYGIVCIWTFSVQGNTLYFAVDYPLNPILELYYFIHEICWCIIRHGWRHVNPFILWRLISASALLGHCRVLKRGFASAEILISFSACVTRLWCFAPVCCFLCFMVLAYSHIFTSVCLSLFPLASFRQNWEAFSMFSSSSEHLSNVTNYLETIHQLHFYLSLAETFQ